MLSLRALFLACAVATAAGAASLIAPGAAHAQDVAMETARGHFDTAQDLFDRGDYAGAAAEFEAAYAAKPFAAFLFNAAVSYEKLKQYEKAVGAFERYLADDPKARDKKDVEKRIAALKAEIERAKTPPTEGTPTEGTPTEGTPTEGTPTETPPRDRTVPGIEALPDVNVKGVVIVESKPAGASIFLDDKKGGAVGVTPWNGSLEGTHTVILESKGYKTEKKKIEPSSDKLLLVYIALSEEHYLGWLEVRANIPQADVYIDDAKFGAVGRTPFMGNVQPGKHKIIVSKAGYTVQEQTLEIEAGKAHNVDVSLEKAPVGFVYVRGETVEGARVWLDGKRVCDSAPCRFEAPSGDHMIDIRKGGKKSLRRTLSIGKATETNLAVKLMPKPGHGDAYWKFGIGLLFVGGGVALGYFADQTLKELEDDIAAGNPPVDMEDDRFLKGKLFAYGADACYAIGGLTILVGIWNLFEDKGPSSTSVAESRDISFMPIMGPDYAGVGGTVRW